MFTKKPTREIEKVFLHCSASDNSKHDNVETIWKWHVEKNKWRDIGYHFIITKNGKIHKCRNIETIPSAQIRHNTGAIAICLTGENNFSQKQFNSLKGLCVEIDELYESNITFHGHCEVSNKLCPVFDYKKILKLNNGKLGL